MVPCIENNAGPIHFLCIHDTLARFMNILRVQFVIKPCFCEDHYSNGVKIRVNN
jgi:hypothetical protein